MKKIFTLMAAFALTMAANAQEMYGKFIDETKTVDVILKNAETVTSLSFRFFFLFVFCFQAEAKKIQLLVYSNN